MADVIYNSFKKDIMDGTIDLDTDTFKIMLVTSGYTPDQDAHSTRANVTNEVTGTGYTAGGLALTNVNPTSTGTTAYIDFADATWASATITAAGALIYNSTTDGGASTTNAVAVISFGGDKTSTNGDFVIQFPTADAANAIVRLA